MKKQQQKDVKLDITTASPIKKCKKIPGGYHVGRGGYLEKDNDNDSEDSNGSKNGGSNGGNGGNGNGNGGNGNGGGGE